MSKKWRINIVLISGSLGAIYAVFLDAPEAAFVVLLTTLIAIATINTEQS